VKGREVTLGEIGDESWAYRIEPEGTAPFTWVFWRYRNVFGYCDSVGRVATDPEQVIRVARAQQHRMRAALGRLSRPARDVARLGCCCLRRLTSRLVYGSAFPPPPASECRILREARHRDRVAERLRAERMLRSVVDGLLRHVAGYAAASGWLEISMFVREAPTMWRCGVVAGHATWGERGGIDSVGR
jgi:hypothetical protein